MIIEILASLVIGYLITVILGFTCIRHDYNTHGPTHHMGLDLKTKQLVGWKREWKVCSRCGKVKAGKQIDG